MSFLLISYGIQQDFSAGSSGRKIWLLMALPHSNTGKGGEVRGEESECTQKGYYITQGWRARAWASEKIKQSCRNNCLPSSMSHLGFFAPFITSQQNKYKVEQRLISTIICYLDLGIWLWKVITVVNSTLHPF